MSSPNPTLCPTCGRRPSERKMMVTLPVLAEVSCDDSIHDLADRCAAMRDALEECVVDGYEDMPTEKVEAIAASGKAWDRPSAKKELRRRAALSRDEEVSGG